jgi:predicted small lipoprotein YifL
MAFRSRRLIRSSPALIALAVLSLLAGCKGPLSASPADVPTTPAPPGNSQPSLRAADTCSGYGAGGWSFAAEASDSDGLVLTGARLGPRQLVQQISVPYIEVAAHWAGTRKVATRRFELTRTPVSGHSGVGTALMTGDVTCHGSGSQSVSASADYVVQGLPSGVAILVWQSYRFDSGTIGCEPSEKLPCNRFWPTVEWGANQAAAGFLKSVRIVQRLQFDPDSGSSVTADIYRDRANPSAILSRTSVETLGRGGLKKETRQLVISDGTRIAKPLMGGCPHACTWDSVHLTDRPSTSSPGADPLDPTPGCSECVHVHWAWDRATNNICHGKVIPGCNYLTGKSFTDGRPELVDGSRQTAYLSVVRYSPAPDELDPVNLAPTQEQKKKKICLNGGYECLVGTSQSLAHGQDVLFWDMTSAGTRSRGAIVINGAAMATGDAAWPQLASFKHGGDGSMFFAPARILTPAASHLTIVPAAPADAVPYPRSTSLGSRERWLLPVRITYACPAKGTALGPFWLAVPADRGSVLNADPVTGAEPGNPAYVAVRAGTTPATGAVALGDKVETMGCQGSPLPRALTTYIEFSRPPAAADLTGLTLLGAPDGSADFTPWDPSTSIPSQFMNFAEASALPATDLSNPTECQAPPAGVPLPAGAPPGIQCLAAVSADLDGNGKPDRLLVWESEPPDDIGGGTGDSPPQMGAVAYLDDGTFHLLEEAPTTWKLPNQITAEELRPAQVVSLADDRRQQVLVTAVVGANTDWQAVFIVGNDRRLHALQATDGTTVALADGGGAGYSSGYGCVDSSSQPLVADESTLTAQGSDGLDHGYTWSIGYYRLLDLQWTHVATRKGKAASVRTHPPIHGSDCSNPDPAHRGPEIGTP